LLATRPQYFAVFFFGAAFLAVAKEFVLADLRDRWSTTAAIFIIAVVTAGLTKFILYLPLLVTVKKLNDAK